MKKLTILSIILAVSLSANAQKKVETTTKTDTIVESSTKTDNVSVDYKIKYKSSFFSNLYIQGSAGGTMLFGEEDTKLSFGDRLMPGFNIAIGKKITPTLGARISIEGNRLLGWNNGTDGSYPNHETDPRKEYLESKGADTSNGYDQNIKYYSLNADFMIDLVNAFSREKRLEKKWDFEGYVGIAAVSTIERKGVDHKTYIGGRLGLSTTYNIGRHFGVNFDLGGLLTSSAFDGHQKDDKFDAICSAKLGLKWKFGKQGFKKSYAISQSQYDELNNYIVAVKTKKMAEDKVVDISPDPDKVLVPFVVFHDGKDTFNQELQMVNISNIAKMLDNNPDYKIDIVGNTTAASADIAESRANKVKDILINRYSISADRLTVKTQNMADKNQTVHFVDKQ